MIDTRPLRLTNNIARRAWLRLASAQPKPYIAPRFLAKVEREHARKETVQSKP